MLANEPKYHTEACFLSFLSGGFSTMVVINTLEKKLAKRTSVQCEKDKVSFVLKLNGAPEEGYQMVLKYIIS